MLSTESIKRDPSVREFLMSLVTKHVNVMSPNSHIDFLNSPPSINTANFIHSLERLVAVSSHTSHTHISVTKSSPCKKLKSNITRFYSL